MIYASQERAEAVARELNSRRGYAPAFAVRTADGWAVVETYRNPAVWAGADIYGRKVLR